MSASSATRMGRRAARKHIFHDWCRVERRTTPDGPAVIDPDTGQYPPPKMLLIYEGPFGIQVRSDINANAVEGVVGDREGTYRTATAMFPLETPADATGTTAAIVSDDILTVLRCPLDASMVGRVMNLQADTKGKTHATMRRFREREPVG